VEFRTRGPVNLADFRKRLVMHSLADAFYVWINHSGPNPMDAMLLWKQSN